MSMLGTGAVAHGAALVGPNTASALLHTYALLIDNVSGGPAFMPFQLVPR